MSSEWFQEVAPSTVTSPDAGYDAIFIADGTGGTTAGSLYKKDSAGMVTALTFSNEQAQDAVGGILTDTATVDFTYDDAGNTISAIVITSPSGQIPVGVTRTISTTAPLTGGGDLSANRTLALTTSPVGQTPVGVTRNIGTTAPLTGGGALSADLTLALTTSPAGQTPVGTTRTITTTTPIQIDGTTSADLSANRTLSILAATTSLAGSLSALDKLKLNDMWKDVVTDGGLNNTGASDNTALLQALHDALPTAGGVLFFPPGTYRFDSTVNITKDSVYLLGQSRRTAKLCTSSATLDMFNISGDACLFEGLRFSTIVAGTPDNTTLRTAGYAANFTSTSDSSGMRKCDILFQWSGIQSSGSLHFFDDMNIREYGNNAINGSCILINGTGDRYITRLTTDNGSNPTGFAGIRITECASCVISDSNIIHAGIALSLEPPNGKTIPSVEVTNTFFDTSVFGMQITTAGTGSVYRSKFTNCWFGTHTTAGIRMNGTQWDGITFDNCDFYNTGPSGIGIDCPTGGGKWTVSNSRIAGFTTGINLTASAAHYPQIVGNTIGPTGNFGLNTTGITVAAGTYKGLMISDNAIVNNTTNVTLGAVTVAAGEASFYQIKDNAGYNPLTGAAVTTPAVAATGVAVTNTTGRRVIIHEKNAATGPTAFAVNGVTVTTFVSLVASAFNTFFLEPGGTIAVTYTVVPTWIWVGQ